MKQATLSDTIITPRSGINKVLVPFIPAKKVKEFIKKRDGLDRLWMLGEITTQEHADQCDELAGEELTK